MITTDLTHLNPELNPKFGKMSAKYVLMHSGELVQNLLNLKVKGEPVFELSSIEFRKPRTAAMQYVGSHTIRLMLRKVFNVGNKDQVRPMLIIKNSYDGHGKFEVRMGLFRQVCLNKLVIQTTEFTEAVLRHMGTPAEAAFEIAKQFAANLPKFQEVHSKMASFDMTDEQMIDFALKAAAIRFKNEFTQTDAEALLTVTRPLDEGNAMWQVFNRVQEKLMSGGIKFDNMKKKSKAIVRAQEDIRINKELFALAMSFVNGDPESNPQPAETVEYEEVTAEEVVEAPVAETPDLEEVTIPAAPTKFLYNPRRPNPAYQIWVDNFGDLVNA